MLFQAKSVSEKVKQPDFQFKRTENGNITNVDKPI